MFFLQLHFSLQSLHRRSPPDIKYLDLDLHAASTKNSNLKTNQSLSSANKPIPSASSVVYKKVDFFKTEAFNKMRQNVEEGYRKNQ